MAACLGRSQRRSRTYHRVLSSCKDLPAKDKEKEKEKEKYYLEEEEYRGS